jgi:hypothetical protein
MKVRKQFFFEKKNQKTFVLGTGDVSTSRAKPTKVFCGAFLQKSDRFLAALLFVALPLAAQAQTSPDLTSQLLIAILVKKGVLSQTDAQSILAQAKQEAASAQTTAVPASSPAATTTVQVTSTTTPDGTIHVTYVPKIVREQIAQQVTQQVVAQEQAQGYAQPNEIPDWLNHIRVFGDFRTRYESDLFPHGNDDTGAFPNFNAINTGSPYDISSANQNFPSQINDDQNRNRFRIRARLGVQADLGGGFAAEIRLATGENDSPVSENQTLGGANGGIQGGDFSKYQLWVDRANITYTPELGPDAELTFSAGRFDNPFFSTNLIFADDLGFDGAAVSGSYDFGGVTPFFTGGAFPVYNTDFNFASNQPAKFPSHDKWMFAAQAGAGFKVTDDLAAKFAIADYAFTNVAGKLSAPCTVLSTADSCSTDDDRPSFAQNGNTYMALRDIIPTTANNNGTTAQYQYFGLASGFNELALTGHVDVNAFAPAQLWFDGEFVKNLAFHFSDVANKAVNNRGAVSASNAAGDFAGGNEGYYFAASAGHQKLQARWDWNATLGYKYLESDAVLDGLTDSDFGLGGTNLKGYILSGSLALNPKVWLRMRYLSADEIAGPAYRADVFQFDLNGKF